MPFRAALPNARVNVLRGRGSAGRAQPCQGWGRGFESRRPLHKSAGQAPSPEGAFRVWLRVPPSLPPIPYRGPMIRRRGSSFEIRVYAGIDVDGKKQNFYATVQGTGRKAEREAKQKEGELLAKAAAGRVPTAAITFDEFADQWLAIAR